MPQQYSVYPIIWAAGRGHAEIVHLLLQHGAKVNCSDKVTTSRRIFIVVLLHYKDGGATSFICCPAFTSVMFAFPPQYGTTPLIWASRKGHYESVMHLLANGADVDQEGAVSKPHRQYFYCYMLHTILFSYCIWCINHKIRS